MLLEKRFNKETLETFCPYHEPTGNPCPPCEHPDMDVSILVPVHNAMPYFQQCIKSLLAQKLSGIRAELVIVESHCSDDSIRFLQSKEQEIRAQFARYTFAVCPEKGAGAARNLCISIAKGRFVLFVDADDKLLSPEYVLSLFKKADAQDADIAVSSMTRIENGKLLLTMPPAHTGTSYREFCRLPGFVAGKMILRERFTGISFPDTLWFEDTIMQLLLVPKCKHVIGVPEVKYGYLKNTTSLTYRKDLSVRSLESVWVLHWILQEAKRLHLPSEYRKHDWNICFDLHFGTLFYNRIRKRSRAEQKAAFLYAGELMRETAKFCKEHSGKGLPLEVRAVWTGNFLLWNSICQIKQTIHAAKTRITRR